MRLLVKEYFNFAGQFSSKISCAFSSRLQGNMSTFYGDTAQALSNRSNFLKSINIKPHDLVCAQQVHGSNIKCVTELERGSGAFKNTDALADTDGLLTDARRIPLAIFTADCPSIFLYDPLRPAVGLIHAGWRSTREGISTKAVKLMQEVFSSVPEELFIGFGPSIKSCCYEVSADFNEYFPGNLIDNRGKFYLDLTQANINQLLSAGVRQENIFDCECCTSCESGNFFSYRLEGKNCGRQMSVVMLK